MLFDHTDFLFDHTDLGCTVFVGEVQEEQS
jgi:hypothetical protein